MSIASLFSFIVGFWSLLITMLAWQTSSSPGGSIDTISARTLLSHWHLLPTHPVNALVLVLAWLLGCCAMMVPPICLRLLGRTMYLPPPLSHAVARRFRGLGHALSCNIVIGFTAAWLAANQIARYRVSLGFGSGFWATVAAALLAYVVAYLLLDGARVDGARAAEKNQEFV